MKSKWSSIYGSHATRPKRCLHNITYLGHAFTHCVHSTSESSECLSLCRVDRLSFLQHNNRTTLYKHFKGLSALHLCRLNTSLSSFNTLSHPSIDSFSLFSLSCRTEMVSVVTFCFMNVGEPCFTSLHPSVRAQSLGEEVNKQCNRASPPAGP